MFNSSSGVYPLELQSTIQTKEMLETSFILQFSVRKDKSKCKRWTTIVCGSIYFTSSYLFIEEKG